MTSSSILYECVHCSSIKCQTIAELEIHLAIDHYHIAPFDCRPCRYANFPTAFALANHLYTTHHITIDAMTVNDLTPSSTRSISDESQNVIRSILIDAIIANQSKFAINGSIADQQASITNADVNIMIGLLKSAKTINHQTNSKLIIDNKCKPHSHAPIQNKQLVSVKIEQKSITDENIQTKQTNFNMKNEQLSTINSKIQLAKSSIDSNISIGKRKYTKRKLTDDNDNDNKLNIVSQKEECYLEKNSNGTRRLIDIGNKNWRQLVLCECGYVIQNTRPAMKYHVSKYHDPNGQVKSVAICSACKARFIPMRHTVIDYRRHVDAYHNGDMSLIIDNRKKVMNRLDNLVDDWFKMERQNTIDMFSLNAIKAKQDFERIKPMMSDPTNSEMQKKIHERVQCLSCNSIYDNNEGVLLNHVARHHQLKPLAECSACNRQFMIYRDGQYLKHAREVHNGDMSLIIDHRHTLMPSLRQMVQQYFIDNPANAVKTTLNDDDQEEGEEHVDDDSNNNNFDETENSIE